MQTVQHHRVELISEHTFQLTAQGDQNDLDADVVTGLEGRSADLRDGVRHSNRSMQFPDHIVPAQPSGLCTIAVSRLQVADSFSDHFGVLEGL